MQSRWTIIPVTLLVPVFQILLQCEISPDNLERDISQILEEVQEVHSKWFDALLEEDTETLDQVLADGVTFSWPNVNMGGKSGFLKSINSGILSYDSSRISLPDTIRLYDSISIINGMSTLWARWDDSPYLYGGTPLYSYISPDVCRLANGGLAINPKKPKGGMTHEQENLFT